MTTLPTSSGNGAATAEPEAAAAPLRLDLGCGQNPREGFTGVDIWAGAEVVCDLESFPWPWPDGSVGEVHCSHYLEHVADMNRFMDELHRVLRPGGQAFIVVPYLRSSRAFQDPTHKQFISEERFFYYSKPWREQNKLDHYPIAADFDCVGGYVFYPDWQNRSEEARAFAVRHYWNVVMDLQVTLTKPERPR